MTLLLYYILTKCDSFQLVGSKVPD